MSGHYSFLGLCLLDTRGGWPQTPKAQEERLWSRTSAGKSSVVLSPSTWAVKTCISGPLHFRAHSSTPGTELPESPTSWAEEGPGALAPAPLTSCSKFKAPGSQCLQRFRAPRLLFFHPLEFQLLLATVSIFLALGNFPYFPRSPAMHLKHVGQTSTSWWAGVACSNPALPGRSGKAS